MRTDPASRSSQPAPCSTETAGHEPGAPHTGAPGFRSTGPVGWSVHAAGIPLWRRVNSKQGGAPGRTALEKSSYIVKGGNAHDRRNQDLLRETRRSFDRRARPVDGEAGPRRETKRGPRHPSYCGDVEEKGLSRARVQDSFRILHAAPKSKRRVGRPAESGGQRVATFPSDTRGPGREPRGSLRGRPPRSPAYRKQHREASFRLCRHDEARGRGVPGRPSAKARLRSLDSQGAFSTGLDRFADRASGVAPTASASGADGATRPPRVAQHPRA